ncbi:hypothetical protein JTE90_022615 [Oedothorax gibbosus]|uniref:Chitin-binding type-2 domain-containing protein n=1 Tax=Oedothorax gibbosus TaxID=931172 RepID=A0AAV6TTD2_9ARAC|nr:hypothetical protein JTE90_022615 [Oedothorax gibbosus]
MQLVNVVLVLLLLLYYYYICRYDSPPPVPKPTQDVEHVPGSFQSTLNLHGTHYHFKIDGQKDWIVTLPDHYDFRQGRIVPQDACAGLVDGSNIPATGPQLYQYLQRDELVPQPLPSFEPDATSTLQDKRVFYFSCRGGQIHQLHMCPPGQIFVDGCQPINMCLGQTDGTLFSDPYNAHQYYECRNGSSDLNECPIGTHFIHDGCKDYEIGIQCPGSDAKILDSKTLLTCDGDLAKFETCPTGYQYFDTPHCENSACVGQLDGTKLALPMETEEHSIQYSPGFMICEGNRVAHIEMCPEQADLYLSPDQLSFLPQVFDGQACTAPILCTNCTPTDPDIVVPVADFTKHVSEWPLSKHYDRVVGTRCNGTTRIKTLLPAGQRIHSTLLKPESACDGSTTQAVVAGFDKYYDCASNSVMNCANGKYFNGATCAPSNPRNHRHHNVDIFNMEPLSNSNWIVPWNYLPKNQVIDACSTPGYVLNRQYNVCIHPDCEKFPFLSKTPFKIGLRDSSECVYQAGQIDKIPSSKPYLFWSQRQVITITDDPCQEGQNVRSGNFVMDSTLFATCDEDQPFVFCPSSYLLGITKQKGHWHCVPPNHIITIPRNQKWEFTNNEVIHVYRYDEEKASGVFINNQKPGTRIPKHSGIDLTGTDVYSLETHDQPVKIVLQYIVLHPPNVVYRYDKGIRNGFVQKASDDKSFLMKRAEFTKLPLDLPEYKVESNLAQYET